MATTVVPRVASRIRRRALTRGGRADGDERAVARYGGRRLLQRRYRTCSANQAAPQAEAERLHINQLIKSDMNIFTKLDALLLIWQAVRRVLA